MGAFPVVAEQALDVRAPLLGQLIAITLDASQKSYDLGTLPIVGLPTAAQDASLPGEVFLTLRSDVAVSIAFGPASGVTLSAGADAAGAAPTLRADGVWPLAANESLRVRVNRKAHRYLYVLGTGAGTLRISASSAARP